MKKLAPLSAVFFVASVIAAAAMPGTPTATHLDQPDVVQVKAQKKMDHTKGQHMSRSPMKMKQGTHMKGDKGMGGMKHDGSMKGM